MAIYMKLGSIAGSVTTKGFEQWIELSSFRWGFVANTSFSQTGAEVTINEVVVTMRAEAASPLTVNAGVSRTVLKPSVKFAITSTAKDSVAAYLTYELSNCVISRYGVEVPAEGHPTETLSLNFTKITETFTPRTANLSGTPNTVTYDVPSAQAV